MFFKVEYIEGAEDFALEAEQRAREDLTPEDFDNLIEITVHDGDKLIPPEKIRIGEIVTIKANGQSWQSVLTGYEKTQNTHKFVFGYVRVDTAKSFHLQIPFSFNGTAYFNWRFLTFHKMYISQIYVV